MMPKHQGKKSSRISFLSFLYRQFTRSQTIQHLIRVLIHISRNVLGPIQNHCFLFNFASLLVPFSLSLKFVLSFAPLYHHGTPHSFIVYLYLHIFVYTPLFLPLCICLPQVIASNIFIVPPRIHSPYLITAGQQFLCTLITSTCSTSTFLTSMNTFHWNHLVARKVVTAVA
jgi:hypothetical protein